MGLLDEGVGFSWWLSTPVKEIHVPRLNDPSDGAAFPPWPQGLTCLQAPGPRTREDEKNPTLQCLKSARKTVEKISCRISTLKVAQKTLRDRESILKIL